MLFHAYWYGKGKGTTLKQSTAFQLPVLAYDCPDQLAGFGKDITSYDFSVILSLTMHYIKTHEWKIFVEANYDFIIYLWSQV